MAQEWGKRLREILLGPATVDELSRDASVVLSYVVTTRDPALYEEMENILMWLQLANEAKDEKAKRRNYAAIVALATTKSKGASEFLKSKSIINAELLNLNESMFYRGYEISRPETVFRHLSAAALRLATAAVYSIRFLDDEMWLQYQKLINIESIKTLGLIFALWVGATVIGGPIAAMVNAALILYGFSALWDEIKAIAGNLRDYFMAAYDANSDNDLDKAGSYFAKALSSGFVTVLELWITSRAFRAIEGTIARRVRTPERLRTEYERSVREREIRRKNTLERLAEGIEGGARGKGMAALAEPEALIGLAVAGAVVVGGVALAAWATSDKGNA